jgi:hypothetical protein
MSREHGTRSRYTWGPDQDGRPGKGCRCTRCGQAKSDAEKLRKRLAAYGRWQPYIDAGPAREHLRMLRGYGIGIKRSAALAGVPLGTVRKIVYGGPGDRPPARRVRPETAAKILEVRPSPDLLGGNSLVCAVGTIRRLQALVAVGYSQNRLAGAIGAAPPDITKLLAGRAQVTAARARAVRALYDELWDKPPQPDRREDKISVSRALRRAGAAGWPPPMAWDDDTIDEPDAKPAEGWRRRAYLSSAELADEAEDLARFGYDRALAAERLQVARNRIDQAYKRARRSA